MCTNVRRDHFCPLEGAMSQEKFILLFGRLSFIFIEVLRTACCGLINLYFRWVTFTFFRRVWSENRIINFTHVQSNAGNQWQVIMKEFIVSFTVLINSSLCLFLVFSQYDICGCVSQSGPSGRGHYRAGSQRTLLSSPLGLNLTWPVWHKRA